MGLHPPSDQFRKKIELNNATLYYPLQVFSCSSCGFKQLNYVVEPKILYQQNYPYESSLTCQVKKHFDEFALSIIQEYNLNKNDLAVDIGSNTGVLLSAFKKKKLKRQRTQFIRKTNCVGLAGCVCVCAVVCVWVREFVAYVVLGGFARVR